MKRTPAALVPLTPRFSDVLGLGAVIDGVASDFVPLLIAGTMRRLGKTAYAKSQLLVGLFRRVSGPLLPSDVVAIDQGQNGAPERDHKKGHREHWFHEIAHHLGVLY